MHQHPRPPPPTASPANSEQTNPTRTNNPRDRDLQALRNTPPLPQGSGTSEDFASNRRDQPVDNPAAQMQRLNQVIQNFHTKAALIILHSRVELSPAYTKAATTKRVNRWFNIELDETDDYKEEIKRWKTCDVKDERPPPLIIEIFLTTEPLHQGQRLVILDEDGKRWDVSNALSSGDADKAGKRRATNQEEVTLERWTIELGDTSTPLPSDLTTILPLVYKKSIVLFRSLYTYCNFLPAWKLARKIGKSRSTMAMKLGYRLKAGTSNSTSSLPDSLGIPLNDNNAEVTDEYSFGVTESPAGPFSVKVEFRQNCDFRVDDSEELLSSRFLGTDDDLFKPSMPSDQRHQKGRAVPEVGSLPNDRRQNLFERPELGHAYGSLSTFHQAGIAPSTSPVSALRNAQDYSEVSPPTTEPVRPTPTPTQPTSQSSRTSLRAQAAGRRTSFSLQPFKTPTLSASPLAGSPLGTSPRTYSGHVPRLGSLTEESGLPLPNAATIAARRPPSLASEQAAASSTSSSPKPAPATRFSSSFSHRRARLSSGGTTTRTDDDQASSGRSAGSSAQPGSGLMAEAGRDPTSSGSMQEDDENIKDFLKMLDQGKDLLGPGDAAAAEASTKRTAAALTRFHRMKDSNAALSDSLSSSLMRERSSTSSSRQLSNVPPMVAATSTSSSPGKPISPHTPHTPFAPSRLSAAYSQDDEPTQHHLTVEEEPTSPSDAATSDTAQARSTTNVHAIDIPNSPRLFVSNFRRSSSAVRRPLSAGNETTDPYSTRSASMGAQDRRPSRLAEAAQADDEQPATDSKAGDTQQQEPSTHLQTNRPATAAAVLTAEEAASESGSGRSSANPFRSRLSRGGAGRGTTTPHGSTSSFGGAGSAEPSGADSGSVSFSWGRGGRRRGSRPENAPEEDDFLPFAMEKSDFQTRKG